MDYSRKRLKWNGWGWHGRTFPFHGKDTDFWKFVQGHLGGHELPDTPSLKWEDVDVGKSKLTAATRKQLISILGEERVCTDQYERVFHALGRSYRDLLRLRTGKLPGAPDVVLYPKGTAEVEAIMKLAVKRNVAVIPFGGGSSVVGGVEAIGAEEHAGVWTVDLSMMENIIAIDTVSMTATVQAGVYGPKLERALQDRGFTLGHYPQSFEFSTLGGWIAAKGAGQQSNRYGAADKWLVSARVVSPNGEWGTVASIPHASTGPDLNHLIAGSEGTLGIITEATVKIHKLPPARDYRGYLFKDFASGVDGLREIVQQEVPIAMARLSDADETSFLMDFKSLGTEETTLKALTNNVLSATGYGEGACILLLGIEGNNSHVKPAVAQTNIICMKHGGLPVGPKAGENWYKNRFEMPYLRDPLMDRGLGVDTLETSTSWSKVSALHRDVIRTINETIRAESAHPGAGALVMCHVSHSYHDGCSLYFTFVFGQATGREMEQWKAIKEAASQVISEHGAAISHHHGVGMDHLPWIEAEKSPLGVGMLKAARNHVDPNGIMNPKKTYLTP